MFKLKLNLNHYFALVKRYISIIISDRLSFITMLLEGPVMVLLIKLTCNKDFTYYNAMMTLFVVVVILITMAVLSSYREVTKERDILKREVQSGLDTKAYILSKITVQAGIALFQTLIIASGVLIFIDIPLSPEQGVNDAGYRIFMLYFICFLTYMASVSLGMLISSVLKSSDSAVLPVLFIIVSQVVLSGALMDLPVGIEWLSFITIAKWALAALGGVFDIQGMYNTMFPEEIYPIRPEPLRAVYQTDLGLSIVIIILLILLCVILSMVVLKRNLKK